MSLVIGIDVGISATKILGIENGVRIKSPMSVKNPLSVRGPGDSISSLLGSFGKYVFDNRINLGDIEHVMVTGVGSKKLKSPIYDLPTTQVDEFRANGLGARFDSGLDHIIVVTMGTGTSLVRVDGDDIAHIGGLSMGGGTILGLSQQLLGTADMGQITDWSSGGTPYMVNLCIDDISDAPLSGLMGNATASLFAKAIDYRHDKEDLAAGIIYMVLETIGCSAVLSQSSGGFKDFVLIGGLTQLPDCKRVFPAMERMFGVRFIIPKYAPYCTALGAALSYRAGDV